MIRRLPLALNSAWFVMHVGVGLAVFGFYRRSDILGWVGAGTLLLGIVIAMLDCRFWRGDRRMSASFSTAIIVLVMAGGFAAVIASVVLAVVAVIAALLGEFSWRGLLNTFHFAGLLIACFFVTGLAGTRELRLEDAADE